MATNLHIDDELLTTAWKLSGRATKREAVEAALSEFVRRRRQKSVLKLFGKLQWDPAYDFKRERNRK